MIDDKWLTDKYIGQAAKDCVAVLSCKSCGYRRETPQNELISFIRCCDAPKQTISIDNVLKGDIRVV